MRNPRIELDFDEIEDLRALERSMRIAPPPDGLRGTRLEPRSSSSSS